MPSPVMRVRISHDWQAIVDARAEEENARRDLGGLRGQREALGRALGRGSRRHPNNHRDERRYQEWPKST
jgi:hypothetical protein